jgi:sec-independent protein translocase protein TatB
LGIVEIIVILAVALIVIPPENLPEVMRAAGKILRELRLASNMVMRELGGALDQPSDHQATPPINTMKPVVGATGRNIAQTRTPADPAPPATPPGSASSDTTDATADATAVAPTPAPTEAAATPAAPEAASTGPKAID